MDGSRLVKGLIAAVLVALGGAGGAVSRYVAGRSLVSVGLTAWPATLVINLLGSFVMGWLFLVLEARFRCDSGSRLEPTPLAGRLRLLGVRLGPDPTLEAVDLFRSRWRLRWISALLISGFLGGFTTLSTFSLEAVSLLQQGRWLQASVHSTLGMLLCPAAVWLGLLVAGRGLSKAAVAARG